MVLDIVSILMILTNIIGMLLTYITFFFFLSRYRSKKLQADLLVSVVSFFLGSFFLLSTVNFILLSNVNQTVLANSPLVAVAMGLGSFVILMLGYLLKTAFRPAVEKATAVTYFIATFVGLSLGSLIFDLGVIQIVWVEFGGPVFNFGTHLGFLIFFLPVLLVSVGWFFYEMINASKYMRERLKTTGTRSPDLARLNILALVALLLPFVLFLPMLPDLQFLPILLSRILLMVCTLLFGALWASGWIMPAFIKKRFS
ncbi:MAG: hypothetical protein ACFFBD_05415 [Candidatus Hodarchaeota archaeon]